MGNLHSAIAPSRVGYSGSLGQYSLARKVNEMIHGHWSVGMWVFLILTPTLMFLLIGASIATGWAMDTWIGGLATFVIGSVVILGITAWVMWPWQMRYHKYTVISGVVQSTSSRFISTDNGNGGSDVNQRFAIEIGGKVYGCDDTRCSLLKKGSPVTLLCKPEYQFNATPGWACNFGKYGLNQ